HHHHHQQQQQQQKQKHYSVPSTGLNQTTRTQPARDIGFSKAWLVSNGHTVLLRPLLHRPVPLLKTLVPGPLDLSGCSASFKPGAIVPVCPFVPLLALSLALPKLSCSLLCPVEALLSPLLCSALLACSLLHFYISSVFSFISLLARITTASILIIMPCIANTSDSTCGFAQKKKRPEANGAKGHGAAHIQELLLLTITARLLQCIKLRTTSAILLPPSQLSPDSALLQFRTGCL
ncbi:hypothetical protein TRV_05556, partial [Trichophyton verrucosum HKI 0517]